MLFEFAAGQLLPALLVELGCYTLRHAASAAARPSPSGALGLRVVSSRRTGPATVVLSDLPGRARLRVPGLQGDPMSQARVGAELRDVAGVADVRANTLTGTVLVRYDPERTGVAQIRARLERPAPPARRRAGTQRAGIDGRQLALVGF